MHRRAARMPAAKGCVFFPLWTDHTPNPRTTPKQTNRKTEQTKTRQEPKSKLSPFFFGLGGVLGFPNHHQALPPHWPTSPNGKIVLVDIVNRKHTNTEMNAALNAHGMTMFSLEPIRLLKMTNLQGYRVRFRTAARCRLHFQALRDRRAVCASQLCLGACACVPRTRPAALDRSFEALQICAVLRVLVFLITDRLSTDRPAMSMCTRIGSKKLHLPTLPSIAFNCVYGVLAFQNCVPHVLRLSLRT